MIASRAFPELGVGDIPTLDVLQTMEAPTSNVLTIRTISNTGKWAPCSGMERWRNSYQESYLTMGGVSPEAFELASV